MAAAMWQQLQPHADLSAAGAAAPYATAAPDGGDRLLRATHALKLHDYETALRLLTQEAEAEPDSHLVYDLRAAACLATGRHEQALDDAMHCTKLNPEWARGWARLGAAQLCLGHARAALSAYQRGLTLAPWSKEMQLGQQLAEQAVTAQAGRREAERHS